MIIGIHEVDLSSGRFRGGEDEFHKLNPCKVGVSSRIGPLVRELLKGSSVRNGGDAHYEVKVLRLNALAWLSIITAASISLGRDWGAKKHQAGCREQ